MLSRVNHLPTYCIAIAEMAFLKALNAGCQFPVASFAEFVDATGSATVAVAKKMKIRGIYWDEKSGKLLKASIVGEVDVANADACKRARELGIALAEKIREQL